MLSVDPDTRRLVALRAIEGGLLRLKWLAAATRFELAARRHMRALKYGYNPLQPRVPRGNPDGGQWTDENGGSSDVPTREQSPSESVRPRGIRLAGEMPTVSPPEVPKERPKDPKERTSIKKIVGRWLDEIGTDIETAVELFELPPWLLKNAAEIETYPTSPKLLEELQRDASRPAPGYDIHHIVEKQQIDHFPHEAINGPDNLVRIPRLKHQEINAWYMTKNPEFGGLSPREYLDGRSWSVQRAVGLEALRRAGVLKP